MKNMTRLFIFFNLIFLLGASSLEGKRNSDILELRIDPPYFSPNDDGIQDQAFFYPVIKTAAEVTRWRMDITTGRGKKVKKLSGPDLPALIKWDGSNKKGQIIPEGSFRVILKVWGPEIKTTSPPKEIYSDLTPPDISLDVSTTVINSQILNNEKFFFKPDYKDASPLDRWQIEIVNEEERSVRIWWSSGPLRDVEWDGRQADNGAVVPQGQYRCEFQAWDKAGNESDIAVNAVRVDIKPSESLPDLLNYIGPFISPLGLIVQIKEEDVFVLRKGKPVLSSEADNYLKEVAILINAYPDVPVSLEGYASGHRKASIDRDRSSHFAWKVYSFLVKKGNVKASRLKVKGRGRHPNFDRRDVDLPLLKNGVEVILEGDREW